MNLYVDIDGTLTTDGESPHGNPVEERIQKVRDLSVKNQIFLWSARGYEYALAFAERHSIVATCLPKPDVFIDDNPKIRPHLQVKPPEFLMELIT